MSKRKIYLAMMLQEETIRKAAKYLKVPKDVFEDVMSQISSLNGVVIICKNPNHGTFECNGLMNDIRRAVKKLKRKYNKQYRIEVHNASATQKKRCLIEIRPMLSDIPVQAKVKFIDGEAVFQDGPFKGSQVNWTTRLDQDCLPNVEEIGEDVFFVKPDVYRSTFYGWKWKS